MYAPNRNMTDRNVVVAKDLTVRYDSFIALSEVTLQIKSGEILGLFGQNGAGKTTFLKTLLGLIPIHEGKLKILDREIRKRSDRKIRKLLGYVSQNQESSNFPITVKDAVAMGRYGKVGFGRKLKKRDWEKVDSSLKKLGIYHLKNRGIQQLSGGQGRRVSIARSLAQDPKILLLDEPTANLDKESQEELGQQIKKLNREQNITIIIASHNSNIAKLCHRIYFFESGRIEN